MSLPQGNEVDPGQRFPGTTNHHVNVMIALGKFTVPGSCEQALSPQTFETYFNYIIDCKCSKFHCPSFFVFVGGGGGGRYSLVPNVSKDTLVLNDS